jgi:hypothetical protein
MINEDSNSISIVITAYNRPKSLKRILDSISKAYYQRNNINLIISIDNGDNQDVLQIANNFNWEYGKKEVIYQKRNLGLRKHILKCGDLTERYNNIILLEDDLYVSKYYYEYAEKALKFYQHDNRIAGISLYSQNFNETAKLPFTPIKNNYDVFFMQLPSSWGQVWSYKQWVLFRTWYKDQEDKVFINRNLPKNVCMWPESSWKKYFIKYMIEKNKYFVYPYSSMSTNFGDVGQHFWKSDTTFQVPLNRDCLDGFRFCNLEDTIALYDVFCENLIIREYISKDIDKESITIDLYAQKNSLTFKRYLLTTKKCNYKIVLSYDMALKPIEENVLNGIKGNNIYLYDTAIMVKSNISRSFTYQNLLIFYYPGLNLIKSIKLLTNRYQLVSNFIGLKKKLKKFSLKK